MFSRVPECFTQQDLKKEISIFSSQSLIAVIFHPGCKRVLGEGSTLHPLLLTDYLSEGDVATELANLACKLSNWQLRRNELIASPH